VRLVVELAEAGTPAEELVLQVLAPAQREVGRRWQEGRWSVAQEHAATAVTDTALGLLTLDVEPEGVGSAVLACVEGEWHTLPARMAAEVLRLRGWDVTFLGPSLPADDLAAFVSRCRPDAVGLSCSMPVSIKGAARSIDACRHAGVPVLAGGPGFGPQGRYAIGLGATAWAPDPLTAAAVMDGWRSGSVSAPPVGAAPDGEHLALERDRDVLVAEALGRLGGIEWTPHRREGLIFLFTAVESAVFVGDPAVLAYCQPAADRLLGSGPGPKPSLADALDAVFAVVGDHLPGARRVLEGGRGLTGERRPR
jgi:MerR family transcriptional regulator, light-induced transcriptional regulator